MFGAKTNRAMMAFSRNKKQAAGPRLILSMCVLIRAHTIPLTRHLFIILVAGSRENQQLLT